MNTEEKIEKLTESIEKIASQIQKFSQDAERKEFEERIEKLKSKEPWWSTAAKFIGLPAAIVLLILNFKQTDNVSTDTELKKAQIDNTKVTTLEKRLAILTDSVSIQKIENAEDRKKLKKDVEDISKLIQEIKEVKASNSSNTFLTRFIILYLFFVCIGLFFRIFSFLWYNFFTSVYRALGDKWRSLSWEGKDEKIQRKYKKRVKYLEWTLVIANGVPQIVQIVLDFTVITIVAIPLFDLACSDLYAVYNFQNIFESIKHLDFVEGANKLKEIIF
jgi:hypothetical protein